MNRRSSSKATNTSLRHLAALNTMKKTTHHVGQRAAIGFTVLIERLALALRMPLRAA